MLPFRCFDKISKMSFQEGEVTKNFHPGREKSQSENKKVLKFMDKLEQLMSKQGLQLKTFFNIRILLT